MMNASKTAELDKNLDRVPLGILTRAVARRRAARRDATVLTAARVSEFQILCDERAEQCYVDVADLQGVSRKGEANHARWTLYQTLDARGWSRREIRVATGHNPERIRLGLKRMLS